MTLHRRVSLAAGAVAALLFLPSIFSAPATADMMTFAPTGPIGGVSINVNGRNNSNQPFPNAGTPVCGSNCVGPPNWSSGATYNFPRFDPSLGTLTRVDLNLVVTHNYGGVVYTNSFGGFWSGGVMNDAGVGGIIARNTITSPAIPGPVIIDSLPEGPITGFAGSFGGTVFRQSPTRSESHPTMSFLDTIGIPSDFIGAGAFPVSISHDPTAQPIVNGNGTNNSLPLRGVSITGVPGSFVVPWTFTRGFSLVNSRVSYTYDPAPGGDQGNPILPDGGTPGPDGGFMFSDAPGGGAWFDPIGAIGYEFETLDGSNFTELQLPVGIEPGGDQMFTISDSENGEVTLSEGSSYLFSSAVDRFRITGIDPPVDAADPLAFPVFLEFDQSSVSFTMTPIIPEPAALALAALMISTVIGVRRS